MINEACCRSIRVAILSDKYPRNKNTWHFCRRLWLYRPASTIEKIMFYMSPSSAHIAVHGYADRLDSLSSIVHVLVAVLARYTCSLIAFLLHVSCASSLVYIYSLISLSRRQRFLPPHAGGVPLPAPPRVDATIEAAAEPNLPVASTSAAPAAVPASHTPATGQQVDGFEWVWFETVLSLQCALHIRRDMKE